MLPTKGCDLCLCTKVSMRWNSLTEIMYRAAAFDVTGRKTSATLSNILRFAHKTARQESSKFYSDLRNASSLALTKYYCINCCCSAVTMPIKLSSYATWSTSETVASVRPPLNTVFFCLADVVSHVSMQPLYRQVPVNPWVWAMDWTIEYVLRYYMGFRIPCAGME